MNLMFDDQMKLQRERAEELLLRQREVFADEYARMECAAAADATNDESDEDMG